VTPRNVIGILRGSDPALEDTCVLLTAHYDHLGERPEESGERNLTMAQMTMAAALYRCWK